MIVEDDKDLRQLFGFALRGAGFDVRQAADGVDALRAIDDQPPDVIILDLLLPTLDGICVRQEIAAHAHTQHVPVVVVTGSTLDVTHLNVAAVLRKPVDADVLIAAVRQAIQAATV